MKYRKGFKYQLAEDAFLQTNIIPPSPIDTKFITLDMSGLLGLRDGYASDGPSGPTIDTETSMAGAFFHDGACQLVRMGKLPHVPEVVAKVNMMAYEKWKASGMYEWRAWWWHRQLTNFGGFALDPKNLKKIYEVP